MLDKMRRQLIPMDYELELLKKIQSLRQGMRTLKEYTKEFHKVLIRIGHFEVNKEKVDCYINGLKPSIQEELALVRITPIEDAY